jgi:hypothetical protein
MHKMAKPEAAGGDVGKWETVRRRKFGALRKLFTHRYAKNGHVFTDDCAGRDDLFLLLCFASLAPSGGHKKIKHIIETQAPWMKPDEAEALADHVNLLTDYEKNFNSRELGERVGLTNAERERLSLWPIKPFDMTDEQLAEQRKAKSRQRRAIKRRDKGVRTKEAYLAELASRPKPWLDEGISQRTWQRRQQKNRAASAKLSRDSDATIVSKEERQVATSERVEAPEEGIQGSGATRRPVEQGWSE